MKRTMPFVVLFLLLAALATVGITVHSSSTALAQTSEQIQTPVPIRITKDATSSYTIMNASSSIGSFDTTYIITGKINDIISSKDLIVSTVESDFNASATIGYVRANATTTPPSNSNGSQTLTNPFVSIETINQKIESELSQAIPTAASQAQEEIEIRCGFGMQLSDFSCSETSLIAR